MFIILFSLRCYGKIFSIGVDFLFNCIFANVVQTVTRRIGISGDPLKLEELEKMFSHCFAWLHFVFLIWSFEVIFPSQLHVVLEAETAAQALVPSWIHRTKPATRPYNLIKTAINMHASLLFPLSFPYKILGLLSSYNFVIALITFQHVNILVSYIWIPYHFAVRKEIIAYSCHLFQVPRPVNGL